MAHNLAPVVAAKHAPLHRALTKRVELVGWMKLPPLPLPMYHAGQDIYGDVVPLRDPS